MINNVPRRTFLQSIASVFAYAAMPFGGAVAPKYYKGRMHGWKYFNYALSKEEIAREWPGIEIKG